MSHDHYSLTVFVPEAEEDEESSEEPEEESSEEISDESSEESSEPEKKIATIYLSKNAGGTAEVTPIEIEYEDEFGPGDAVNAIAEETWLNFSLIYQPYGEDIYIYCSPTAALTGYSREGLRPSNPVPSAKC